MATRPLGAPSGVEEALAAFDRLAATFAAARAEVERHVIGQGAVVEQALVALLAGGHGLLVGLPGLAKTRLVKTLGAALGLDTRRIQFTPDLMPSDILGAEVLETTAEGGRAFRFIPGPVFAELVMAEEINR
ncbi:MAG: AAA family ATPase, partial [Sphingomonadaceae bacterium]